MFFPNNKLRRIIDNPTSISVSESELSVCAFPLYKYIFNDFTHDKNNLLNNFPKVL